MRAGLCGSRMCVREPCLPAIQAPRRIRQTEVMLSQANQLPHKPVPTSTPASTCAYLRRGLRCSSSVRIGTGCSGGSIKPSATPRSWSQF
ncbi:hypothetical protein F0170_14445 [Pseudomonas sp. MAFF 730085]|uniref:Uncharacterized protein n=1 Tax=Pseudomonas kitaguniensis TaxID=2607908 RepID=A0A5N7JUK6_9PSED|nr:hypothetical protein [Pseudomonas kitaguniensis]